MEYIKIFTNCGCQIVISGELHDAKIRYCPRHKAAPSMYEALQQALLQINYLHGKFKETGSGNQVIARIQQALAKAEGTKQD